MFWIALLVMISSTLIQHLGLAEAISNVISKVFSCSTCFTFWTCLVCMLYLGNGMIIAVVLSILMAYISNWFVLLLIELQKVFDKLYDKESNQKEGGDSEVSPHDND